MAKPSLRSLGIAFFTALIFYLLHTALAVKLHGFLLGVILVLVTTIVYGFMRMIRKIKSPGMMDLVMLGLFALLLTGTLWGASLFFKVPLVTGRIAITAVIEVFIVTFLMELVY